MNDRQKNAANKSGIHDKVTPHMLRHTFAPSMYDPGANIGFSARQLGHKFLNTTRRYTYLNSVARMYIRFQVI